MSAKKIITVFTLAAIFTNCCFATEEAIVQQPNPADLPYTTAASLNSELAGLPNPALVGFNALRIVIMYQNMELETASITFTEIATRAQMRLAQADYRLAILLEQGYASRFVDVPTLSINIDNIYLIPDRPPIYIVKTTFSNSINPLYGRSAVLKIDLWSRTETIQAESVETWTLAIESLIIRHIDAFAKDFISANTQVAYPEMGDANSPVIITPRPLDANQVATPYSSGQPETQKAAQQAGYQYVGSKASGVFHKPDCPWVKNILPKNFVTYATRQDALDAGKKPCKKCNP